MRGQILWASVAMIALAGCGGNVKPGFVAKQWAGEMRELQINPVFPPREDFQVGDMYLPPVPQESIAQKVEEEGYLPISVWLMEAGGPGGAAQALEEFYAKRSTYPQTSQAVVDAVEQTGASADGNDDTDTGGNGEGSGGDDGLSGPVPQPVLDCGDVQGTDGKDCNIFTSREKSSLRRMRIVGFPTFLSTSITEGNLSAFVPIEAFTAAVGLDFGDVDKVSVSVPVAESVGLPAMNALKLARQSLAGAQDRLCPGNSSGGTREVGAIAAVLPDGQRTDDGRVGPVFHAIVVTEVFYTRAIEISVETQESFGLGGKVSPSGSSGSSGSDQQAAPQGGGTTDGAGGSSNAVPSPADRLRQLREATSDLPSTPGGSLQVVSVSDGNVGMRRIYDRPVAIGYRGLSLTIDSQTCRITGGGAADNVGAMSHTPVPARTDAPNPTDDDAAAQ